MGDLAQRRITGREAPPWIDVDEKTTVYVFHTDDRMIAFTGDNVRDMRLSAEQARELAQLLLDAADRRDAEQAAG